MANRLVAQAIMSDVLKDLFGRQGLRHILEKILYETPDIYKELEEELTEVILKRLESEE